MLACVAKFDSKVVKDAAGAKTAAEKEKEKQAKENKKKAEKDAAARATSVAMQKSYGDANIRHGTHRDQGHAVLR